LYIHQLQTTCCCQASLPCSLECDSQQYLLKAIWLDPIRDRIKPKFRE
jgi:hypothetical protein